MRLEASLNRILRLLAQGPPQRRPRRRPEISHPGDRAVHDPGRTLVAYMAALVLPVVAAAALIPLREGHPRVTGLLLVLPVLVVAAIGSPGSAVLAAVTAGVSYDFLLTQPHYRLAIEDPDEVVAMIVIVAVGAVVGILSSRLARAASRSRIRQDELHHLVAFVRTTAQATSAAQLTEAAAAHIGDVLGARSCRWRAGYHGGGSAVLLDTGAVMYRLTDLPPDRGQLPAQLEVPIGVGDRAVGRFIVTTTPGHLVSDEERATAAAIAMLLTALVTRRPQDPPPDPDPDADTE